MPQDIVPFFQQSLQLPKKAAESFYAMIMGIIKTRSCQQHYMALGFENNASNSANLKKIEYFLQNNDINLINLAKAYMAFSEIKGPFDLIMDRTNWKNGK